MSKLSTLRGNLENDAKARRRFANVIFQCVASTDLSSDLKESDKSPLTSEILRLLRSIRSGRKDSAETCLELVRKRFLQFIPGKDHDSGEFYNCLIEVLRDEDPTGKIEDLTANTMLNNIKCKRCHCDHPDQKSSIVVGMKPKFIKVEEQLNEFLNSTQTKKLFCSICGIQTFSDSIPIFHVLPKYLVINFDRMGKDEIKDMTRFEVEPSIAIESTDRTEKAIFSLRGFVVHKRNHFYAFVKDGLDDWMKADDMGSVTRVDFKSVQREEATVLFYQKEQISFESVSTPRKAPITSIKPESKLRKVVCVGKYPFAMKVAQTLFLPSFEKHDLLRTEIVDGRSDEVFDFLKMSAQGMAGTQDLAKKIIQARIKKDANLKQVLSFESVEEMISFMQRIDKTALLVVLPPDINFTDQERKSLRSFVVYEVKSSANEEEQILKIREKFFH